MTRIGATDRQLALDLPHRAALGRDDFMVAACNAETVAWIDRWPDWPQRVLAIYGPAGSGKSHLASVFRARSNAMALAGAVLAEADPLLLDRAARGAVLDLDGDFAPLGAGAERGLLHLLNTARERQGTILIAARIAPSRWAVALPDLASRLAAIPAVAITPPDDELIRALLVKLFADRQLRVGADIVSFIAERSERSFAAARACVAAVDRAALSDRRRITVRLVREILDAMPR